MAEENDTLKLTSVNYTSDNYLAAKKNEDGSYNVAGKVVFNEDITTPGGGVATKADLDGKQDNVGLFIDDGGNVSVGTGIKQYGMTSINYFEGLTQFEAGAEINNNAKINGQIIQSGMPYENYFEGLTRFGGSVEFQGDIKIGDQHPVLNLYSSDNSVTVTRDLDGYGFDLKANGASGDNELYAFRIYLNRQDPSEFNRAVEYLVNDIVRNLLKPWYGGKLFCTYTDPTSQPFNSSESFSFTNMTEVMGDTITVILEENGPIDKKEFVHKLKYQILVPGEDFVELLPKPVYSGL